MNAAAAVPGSSGLPCRPVRPTRQWPAVLAVLGWLWGCAAPEKMTVVIHMIPPQEEHFRRAVIPAFEKEHRVTVEVVSLERIADLPETIAGADDSGGVSLVKVPFDLTRVLKGRNLIVPLDSVLSSAKVDKLLSEYFLMDLVRIDSLYYYLPRKFETRVLLYLKSRVREAVQGWTEVREEVHSVLKRHNGYGLPAEYRLEKDPAEWDYFDVFVVGYYWKSREIGGRKVARVAHRSSRNSGTTLRLIDRAYQLGTGPEGILRMSDEAVAHAFAWEALYAKEGIYNPRMLTEEWDGEDLREGFGRGDVFLSFMTQLDAFFLHGTGTEDMPGYLPQPDDMGMAVMPRGVSLELTSYGRPVVEGGRGVTTGGWWWGIPRNTPNAGLSVELARHITNTKNQIEGCVGFGMVPVRKDILSELGLMFGGGWISRVYHVASQQLVENRLRVIPLVDVYDQVGRIYLDAFYDIAIGGNSGPGERVDTEFIRYRLASVYADRQKALLGTGYPAPAPKVPAGWKGKKKSEALQENPE